ncbi:hypothetical protein QBC46DRAFT_410158 [Diplogelasinospora grovesii]|uniref:DUF7918 domain-containing protein n=1 Tax=Diplogelasinospora grovesii TaxID=303347 RepID=A0AAN6N572_9PEZI|nr:hypothetical protein QBC46DRAFT_410158 [Diplogelasinospora grovesii]
MAILDEVPGIEVGIEVDGQTAQEYDQPIDDVKYLGEAGGFPRVTKYIEAKSGAPFAFLVKKVPGLFYQPSHQIGVEVSVDGRTDMQGWVETKGARSTWDLPWDCKRSAVWVGRSHSGYYSASLKFANLDRVLDSRQLLFRAVERAIRKSGEIGTIKVRLFYFNQTVLSNRSVAYVTPPPEAQSVKVAEKAMKGRAVDCVVGFTPQGIRPRGSYHISYFDKRPYAEFEFRYRSKEGLIQEGIIPRPPPADEVDEMSEAEVRRLAREYIELKRSRSVAPREEKPPVKGENSRGVKREAEDEANASFLARYKQRRLDDGTLMVDLTDD